MSTGPQVALSVTLYGAHAATVTGVPPLMTGASPSKAAIVRPESAGERATVALMKYVPPRRTIVGEGDPLLRVTARAPGIVRLGKACVPGLASEPAAGSTKTQTPVHADAERPAAGARRGAGDDDDGAGE